MTNRTLIHTAVVGVAAVSLLAAGCGGGSSTTAATTTTATQNGALSYALCMRSHRIPNFPDPNSSGGTVRKPLLARYKASATPGSWRPRQPAAT